MTVCRCGISPTHYRWQLSSSQILWLMKTTNKCIPMHAQTTIVIIESKDKTKVLGNIDRIGILIDHEKYPLLQIKKDMMELADMFPGANVSIEIIGRTAEYNDIIMLKIAEKKSEISRYFRADESKYIDEVPEKRIVLIVHGLSVMGLRLLPCMDKMSKIKELVSYYIAHLDKFDIFWVPVGNPDGFVRRVSIHERFFKMTYNTEKNVRGTKSA